MANARPAGDRLLDEKETSRLCGGSHRTSHWRWTRDHGFPKPVKIGPRRVGRWESEIVAWLERNRRAAQ